MPEETPEMKWEGAEVPEWAAQVEDWPWQPIGGGDWAKSGDCPRCTHRIRIVRSGGVVADVAISEESKHALIVGALNQPSDGDKPRDFFARCNCSVTHPSRPPGLNDGCGRWGWVTGPDDE